MKNTITGDKSVKKIFLRTMYVMLGIAMLALPSLFLTSENSSLEVAQNPAKTNTTTPSTGTVENSGLWNEVVDNNYTGTIFREVKNSGTTTYAVTYLSITIPNNSSDVEIKYVVGSTPKIQTNDELRNTSNPGGKEISKTSGGTYFFTRPARYEVTFTLNEITYNASCSFEPTIQMSSLTWLTQHKNGNYYALEEKASADIKVNEDLFTADTVSVENNSYTKKSFKIVSNATKQWFIIEYFELTVGFELGFYDKNDATLDSVYKKDGASPFNIFNSAVKVKVELISDYNYTIDNDLNPEDIYDLFAFSSTGNTNNYTQENNVFLYSETLENTYTLRYKFLDLDSNATSIDIDTLKIITALPNTSGLSITFVGASNPKYDYIKDYFAATNNATPIINSDNCTINIAGPRNLIFSSTGSGFENIKIDGTNFYYTYTNGTGYSNVYAFRFVVNHLDTNISKNPLSNLFTETDNENKFTGGDTSYYGNYSKYSFKVDNDSGLLRMRLTINGVKYDYKIQSESQEFTLSAPGDYVVEIYGFNNYDMIQSVWDSATGFTGDYEKEYKQANTYNTNPNPYPVLKRSFRIQGPYTTATMPNGDYLFNNQLTNSQMITVRINDQQNQNNKYEVFFNNKFYSDNITGISEGGALFTTPGLWTIKLYNHDILQDTFSFTILSRTYQSFSFYSDPLAYENIEVKMGDKVIERPENNIYHFQEKGSYRVISTYKSSMVLNSSSGNASLSAETNTEFVFEIKASNFSIQLENGNNGDRITNNVVILSTLSDIDATKMDVYLNGNLIRTYNSVQTTYINLMSAGDRTFTENGIYTIVIYDSYGNSYQLQIEKYYKMNIATSVLIAVAIVVVLVVLFMIIRLRRGVRVK